jgi:hypothetical protein
MTATDAFPPLAHTQSFTVRGISPQRRIMAVSRSRSFRPSLYIYTSQWSSIRASICACHWSGTVSGPSELSRLWGSGCASRIRLKFPCSGMPSPHLAAIMIAPPFFVIPAAALSPFTAWYRFWSSGYPLLVVRTISYKPFTRAMECSPTKAQPASCAAESSPRISL